MIVLTDKHKKLIDVAVDASIVNEYPVVYKNGKRVQIIDKAPKAGEEFVVTMNNGKYSVFKYFEGLGEWKMQRYDSELVGDSVGWISHVFRQIDTVYVMDHIDSMLMEPWSENLQFPRYK